MRTVFVAAFALVSSVALAQTITTEELRDANDYCHQEYLALTRTHQLPSKELLAKCEPVRAELQRREDERRAANGVKADEIFKKFQKQ